MMHELDPTMYYLWTGRGGERAYKLCVKLDDKTEIKRLIIENAGTVEHSQDWNSAEIACIRPKITRGLI